MPVLRSHNKLWVTTGDGREVVGFLTHQSSDAIRLTAGGLETIIPSADIRRIEQRVNFPWARNGARIGAVAGSLVVAGLFLTSDNVPHCNGCLPIAIGETLLLSAMGAGMGGAFGLAVGVTHDRLHERRELVYWRSPAAHTPVRADETRVVVISVRIRW
jgi:hypothetical protein